MPRPATSSDATSPHSSTPQKARPAAEDTRMHAYIALCLATGIRTEEARALRWENVDFGDPGADPPVPASAAVWRSVRGHEDTKPRNPAGPWPCPRWLRTR